LNDEARGVRRSEGEGRSRGVRIYPDDLVQINDHKVKVNCLEYRARKWYCTLGTG